MFGCLIVVEFYLEIIKCFFFILEVNNVILILILLDFLKMDILVRDFINSMRNK